ncbi:MAG TPA: cupredoxin domain-containing protein [Stellaceae bacterium]|jgi:plastocyanin|nr:cupredoxin domain-containing protein [Stellaceae bacterium]
MLPLRRATLLAVLILAAAPVAAQNVSPTITIQNRQFVPAELTIPAGQKVELIVRNQQQTPAEFESTSLHREKVVPPGGQISVFIGPLQPGRYEFFDDFNQAARGFIVVK